MAVATTTILAAAAIGSLAVGAYSVYAQQQAAGQAQDAADKSAEAQRKANAEQRAQQAQMAAQERRKQFREERVRRAMVIQSAINTGTADSSGALGAQGALATNLGSNLGFNVGEVARGGRIGALQDTSSAAMSQAQGYQNTASMWGSIGNLSQSVFSNLGGFKTIKAGFSG